MPVVTPITSLPTYSSPEEHQSILASTPSSFTDIPPVLKHTQKNVVVKLDPPVEGISEAQGTLYILTSVLAFMSDGGGGFQIEYPAITLHAISRGRGGPSIYCQLEDGGAATGAATTVLADPPTSAGGGGGEEGDEDDADEDEEEYTPLQEFSIFPQDLGSLEEIFDSLSKCAALHPDPHSANEGEDDDAIMDPSSETSFETFTGDEGQELSEVGRAALEYMESIIQDPHDLLKPRSVDLGDVVDDDDDEEFPPDSESETEDNEEEETKAKAVEDHQNDGEIETKIEK